jgi:hypothetical protein
MSCVRVQSLTRYANTTNPTYDTLASATWSVVELNVGVFCVCMPAFRRFLAHAMPTRFGFGFSDDDAACTPSELGDLDAKNVNKRKGTLPRSLFETNAIKTVDTRMETERPDEDQWQLVAVGQRGPNTNSIAGSTEDGQSRPDSFHIQQLNKTTPRQW